MQTAVRLSNRQYNLIREIMSENGISLARMLSINQTTAGASVRRGWFKWSPGRALFMLTESGRDAIEAFVHTDISRKNQKAPLSKFIGSARRARAAKVANNADNR